MAPQETIASIKPPSLISLSGFEALESISHMIDWLGRELPFRQFMIGDVERELYSQDNASQLVTVQLNGEPKLETKALPANDGTSHAVVTKFEMSLPISLIVKASNGQHWRLSVSLSYSAGNLNIPSAKTLQLGFNIQKAECIPSPDA